MYDYTLRRGRKHFCCYSLQVFRKADVLKCHIKDCFKINGKQRIKMPAKSEYVKFENHKKKIKASFVISADFEDNVKQNSNESYTNKYKKLVPCSYGYKLVCVDDKFSRPFKSY